MWSTPWSRTASTNMERPSCLYAGPQDEEALDDPLVGTTREQFGGYVAALVGTGLTANDASNVAWMLLVVRR